MEPHREVAVRWPIKAYESNRTFPSGQVRVSVVPGGLLTSVTILLLLWSPPVEVLAAGSPSTPVACPPVSLPVDTPVKFQDSVAYSCVMAGTNSTGAEVPFHSWGAALFVLKGPFDQQVTLTDCCNPDSYYAMWATTDQTLGSGWFEVAKTRQLQSDPGLVAPAYDSHWSGNGSKPSSISFEVLVPKGVTYYLRVHNLLFNEIGTRLVTACGVSVSRILAQGCSVPGVHVSPGFDPSRYNVTFAGVGGGAFVEVRGIETYGHWYPEDQSPFGVISMLERLHKATGVPVGILGIVGGPQETGQAIRGQGITVDDFLEKLKVAAGGEIIPTLNMNYYTSGANLTSRGYCDPHNGSNCGPSWFWQVSGELLNLTAVRTGGREVLLEGWDQWYRAVNSTTVTKVLAGLKSQGWSDLIMKELQIPKSPNRDYGFASYMDMAPQCQSSAPYCFEDQPKIAKELNRDSAYLKGVLAVFDYQVWNSPRPETDLTRFLLNFSASQQSLAIASLAESQGSGRYTFVYPLIVGTSRDGAQLYWDAATQVRPDGKSFFGFIVSLMKQLNV